VPRRRFLHFANDQLALIFRVDIESLAGASNCFFVARGSDDAHVPEAIALLPVDTPNARLLPYPSHGLGPSSSVKSLSRD
jgi:hypothetical protein